MDFELPLVDVTQQKGLQEVTEMHMSAMRTLHNEWSNFDLNKTRERDVTHPLLKFACQLQAEKSNMEGKERILAMGMLSKMMTEIQRAISVHYKDSLGAAIKILSYWNQIIDEANKENELIEKYDDIISMAHKSGMTKVVEGEYQYGDEQEGESSQVAEKWSAGEDGEGG